MTFGLPRLGQSCVDWLEILFLGHDSAKCAFDFGWDVWTFISFGCSAATVRLRRTGYLPYPVAAAPAAADAAKVSVKLKAHLAETWRKSQSTQHWMGPAILMPVAELTACRPNASKLPRVPPHLCMFAYARFIEAGQLGQPSRRARPSIAVNFCDCQWRKRAKPLYRAHYAY